MGSDDDAAKARLQVFLSYGRRDAAGVADEVAGFLVAEGFRVWRDRPEIRPGVPFLEEIEAAIHASNVVVALLSPHSVRRAADADELDSVCLDELSFARFSKPARPIVPAMAVACDPPMVIYRQDYVDLMKKAERTQALSRLREGIDDALQGRVRYRSWVHSLRPLDFASFLREKRRDFVGREWLYARVMEWLDQAAGEPALILKADPGAGKSAFVASLVERNPSSLLGYHCCQASASETLKPGRFVQSMAAMIASRLPHYESRLTGLLDTILDEARCEADPFTAFDEGVLAPLAEIDAPANKAAFLLIDSLDEALLHRGTTNQPTIFNVLADRLGRFPPWLRVVATTRKDADVLRKLRGLRHEEIDVHSAENLVDVEAYVRARGARDDIQKVLGNDPQRLDALMRKMRAAGNFLFVAQMLNALGRPGASLDDLDRLPAGLYGLYEDFFNRTFAAPDGLSQLASARTLLSVILAAQQPLGEAELALVTGFREDDELPALLNLLAPYLPAHEDDEGLERFAVYHKSFADWLQDPDLRGTKWYVSTRVGHQKLAAQFVKEYDSGVEHLSAYCLAHGLLHLGLSGERQRLYEVLTDPAYVRTVFGRLGPVALVQIVDRAQAAFEPGSERDTVVALASALRLSLSAVTQDPAEFEVQLEARLRKVDALAAFRAGLRAHFSPEALVPITMPLTQASGALLLSLKAGFAVDAVCVYEAGNQVVTGDEEGQLRLWWLDSGAPILTADVSPLSFSCGVADPERPLAAFGTYEGIIVRFDLDTGEVRRCEALKLGAVDALALDPARQTLLSSHHKDRAAGKSGSVLACWSWPSLELLWKRQMKDESLDSVCWSRDGSAIYVAAKTRLLRTDANGANPVTLRTAPKLETVDPGNERMTHTYSTLAVRADGTIALGLDDGRIEVFDQAGTDLRLTLPGHPMEYYTTAVSGLYFAGKDELISAGWDEAIRIWSVASGEELRSVRGKSKIYAFDVFDEGRKAVSGHKMLAANVWNLTAPGRVEGEGLVCHSLHVSETLGMAVACIGRRRVAAWDIATLAARHFVFDDVVECVGLDAERGELVVLVGRQVRALDLRKEDAPGQHLDTFDLGYGYISHASWSPSGRILAIDAGSKAQVWRREGGLSSFGLPKDEFTIYSLGVSDAVLAVATSSQIRFHNLAGQRSRVRTAKLDAPPGGTAFSPDGHTLAIFDELGNVDGFDPSTGKRRWRVASHDKWLHSMYLTDGGLVCATSVDALSVYDSAKGRRIAHLRSENGWAECWMPESGKTLLVGGYEGRLHQLSRTVMDSMAPGRHA